MKDAMIWKERQMKTKEETDRKRQRKVINREEENAKPETEADREQE